MRYGKWRKAVYVNSAIAQPSLRNLARGKRSHIPVHVLAEYLLNYCTPGASSTRAPAPQDDSLQFLDRLYALKDPRPS